MELQEHCDHAAVTCSPLNSEAKQSVAQGVDLSSEDVQNSEQLDGKLDHHGTTRWKNLLFGQFIAFVATSQNVISFALESKMGMVFPLFLMLPAYAILSLNLFANRL
jgi:hypothetical protein